MILLLAFILSFLVALLRGGNPARLALLELRFGWLALVALLMQIGVIYFPAAAYGGPLGSRTLLLMGSYALLIGVTALNWKLPGFPIIGLGLALNLLVMVVNGGIMTISPETLERIGLAHYALGAEPGARVMATKDILLSREQTRLWFLSDVLVTPRWSPIRSAFSIGDVVLATGGFVLFQRAMSPPDRGPTERPVVDESSFPSM